MPVKLKYSACLMAAIIGLPMAVYAHKGATGAVKARMDGMSAINDHMKIISAMISGKADMDRATLSQQAFALSKRAAQIPSQFQNTEMSAISEASPAIWEKPERFNKIAADLEKFAENLGQEAARSSEISILQARFKVVRATCGACHTEFTTRN